MAQPVGVFMQRIQYWCQVLILGLVLSSPALAQPAAWSDWQHGARGHAQALSAAERAMEPLVVYFHVEWCPWCRKLNDRYLRTGDVRNTLSRMQKVEINPEQDASGQG